MMKIFFICFSIVIIYFSFSIEKSRNKKIPVIIDTDFGNDIDDAFAIAYILSQNEIFDIKLIITCQHNTTGISILVAKLLTELGRNDIPIAVGIETPYDKNLISGVGPLFNWAENFTVNDYKGKIYANGIEMLRETIRNASREHPIYLIGMGPLTNIANILIREPILSNKFKLFIVGSSIYSGFCGKEKIAEYNINMNILLFYVYKVDIFFLSYFTSTSLKDKDKK